MNLEELKKLVSTGESETLEFKKSTGQRTEAAKTICAMLNGQGGQVIFGVANNGEIVGQEVATRTLEDLANEYRRIDPQVTPAVETVEIGGNSAIIVVTVSGGGGPYTYDDRPYIRSGPVTQRMDKHQYEIRLTERMHPKTRWELLPVSKGVSIADLDADEIQITLENATRIGRMDRPRRTDTQSILTGLKLIEDGKLINAALVLYGKSSKVENIFPQFAIRMARFRGINKIADFSDNRQYWGNAFELLRRAESFLLDHVPIAGRVVPEQFRRIDQPWYPPRATREALANALCHRDYTSHGGAISLAMYDDRIEIENPNGLHFGFTPEKLTRPHNSQPWNPRIAEVFYRAGVIEKWGTGTINILDWCKENRNPAPKWEVRDPESIAITFFPVQELYESDLSQTGARPGSEPKSGPKLKPKSGPKSLQEKVLELLEQGPLFKSEIATHLGQKSVSGRLKKVFQILLGENLIAYTIPDKPRSRLQKYKLVKKPEK